ncbi:MAG: substrate-binding domain-containing protein [Rhodobacter sp.]|nr:substrate-binding domain-containing protein [Rhodobacter sp.]
MAAKRVTLADVAAEAGVGVATVDRVLNARAPVSAGAAARVLAAAEALGYHAHRLIRHRIEEMAPEKVLGFILQKEGKWFYRALAKALQGAAADLRGIRATVEICYVESLSPEALAAEIARMRDVADAIGVVSLEHPSVEAAVAACAHDGMPVFALLSPLSFPGLAGYIGIDSYKAGRTAGWAMARMVRDDAEIGVLVGSHRYLGHEALESGFRSAMRDYAPGARLRESLVFLDDGAVAYEAALELLQARPCLAGLYHCGGGTSGVVRALRESGRHRNVLYICHERGPVTEGGLRDGTVELVIATPLDAVAQAAAGAMQAALTGRGGGATEPLAFRLLTAENL